MKNNLNWLVMGIKKELYLKSQYVNKLNTKDETAT